MIKCMCVSFLCVWLLTNVYAWDIPITRALCLYITNRGQQPAVNIPCIRATSPPTQISEIKAFVVCECLCGRSQYMRPHIARHGTGYRRGLVLKNKHLPKGGEDIKEATSTTEPPSLRIQFVL